MKRDLGGFGGGKLGRGGERDGECRQVLVKLCGNLMG